MVDFGANTLTNATNFDHGVLVLIERVLEERLRHPLLHLMPGNFVPANLVKGSNGTLRFRNIPDMTPPTVSSMATPTPGTAPWLTEGTTPTLAALAFGFEEFTAYQAGRGIGIGDKAIRNDPVDLVAEGVNVVSFDAINVMDMRVAQVILAGTNVLYAGAATNAATTDVAAGDVVKGQLIKRAVAKLRRTPVPAFGDGYRAILDPGVEFDIQSDDDIGGWIDASRYAGADAIKSGLIGQYAGVQFSQSAGAGSKLAGGAGGIDVYSTVIFGTKSYAFGDWGSVEMNVTPPGGHSDPFKLSAIVTWKADFGAMLIGEGTSASNVSSSRYIRLESASNV